jgi:hypothetical protein
MTMTTENTELALFEEITEDKAPAIYGHSKLDQFYDAVKSQVTGEVPDLTTDKGRKRIASLSAKVSSSKTAVEKPGREYLKRLKDLPKTIEKELREFVDKMDALRDEVRKPLTDYENAEKLRVENHRLAIQAIVDIGNGFIAGEPQSFGLLFSDLDLIKVDESFQEFEAEAHREKENSKSTIEFCDDNDQSRAIAVRRAIARAAAEIGRRMK